MTRKNKLFITAAAVTALAAISLYSVLSSAWMTRKAYLQRFEEGLGAPIRARSTVFYLSRAEILLNAVEIGPEGAPFLKAETLLCQVNLSALLGAKPKIQKVRGERAALFIPTIRDWVENGSKHPLRTDISDILLKDLTVDMPLSEDKNPPRFRLMEAILELDRLKDQSGGECELMGKAELRLSSERTARFEKARAALSFALPDSLCPTTANIEMELSAGNGDLFADRAAGSPPMRAALKLATKDASLTIESFKMTEAVGDKKLTDINLLGDIAFNPFLAKLEYDIQRVSPEAAALLGLFIQGRPFPACAARGKGRLVRSPTELTAKGEFYLSEWTLPGTRPLNAVNRHDLTLDAPSGVLTTREFDTRIIGGGGESFEVRALAPFSMTWKAGDIQFNGAPPKIVLKATNFPLNVFHALFPSTPSFAGVIDATFQSSEKKGDETVISGAFETRPPPDSGPNACSTKGSFTARLDDAKNRLYLEKSELTWLLDRTPAGALIVSGKFDLPTLEGRTELTARLAKPFLDRFIPHLLGERGGAFPDFIRKQSFSDGKMEGDLAFSANKKTARLNEFSASFNGENNVFLGFNLLAPALVHWQNGKLEAMDEFSIRTGLTCSGFRLADLNVFLPPSCPWRFDAGNVTCKLAIASQKSGKETRVEGEMEYADLAGRYNALKVQNIDARQRFKFLLEEYRRLTVSELKTSLRVNRKNALELHQNFTWNADDRSGRFRCVLDYCNQLAIDALTPETRALVRAETFNFQGHAEGDFKAFPENWSLAGEALLSLEPRQTARSVVRSASGAARYNLRKRKTEIIAEDLGISLKDKDTPLIDVSAKGALAWPFASGKTRLELSARAVDIAILDAIADPALFPRPFFSAARADAGPNETDARVILDLRDIVYGPDVRADIAAELVAKPNALTLAPFTLTVNGAAIRGDARAAFNKESSMFSYRAETADLNLGPLMKTFLPPPYDAARGVIAFLKCEGQCGDFLDTAPFDKFAGTLSAEFRGVSLPLARDTQSDSVSHFLAALSPPETPSSVREAEFATGETRLSARKGEIAIEKCHFSGDFIKAYDLTGSVRTNGTLAARGEIRTEKRRSAFSLEGTTAVPIVKWTPGPE